MCAVLLQHMIIYCRPPPYEMIFGIVAGIICLIVIFGFALYRLHKCRFKMDKDSEKQGFKGREEVASTVSSVPPYPKCKGFFLSQFTVVVC